MSLGLYVHVPFCSAICSYCNFNRGLFDSALKTKYVAALLGEIRAAADGAHRSAIHSDTLYLGGGTPSLLDPVEINAIIRTSRELLGLADDAEVTLEANPESVDEERLRAFRQAGVNRVSFGVQSFRSDELARLGRLHSAARAMEAIDEARTAGLGNISLDLMMWLPGQTVDQWLESVERAALLQPSHVSLYMLEVYPHLPLKQEMVRSGWSQSSDESAAEMYERAMEVFEAAGYEQYEISNVAKRGMRSRHNLKYWSDGEWLGFGPGAHSTREGVRWRNVASVEDYVARVDAGESVTAERRVLSFDERLGDALFTGLRLCEGVELAEMNHRYQTDVWQRYGEDLTPFLDAGLLVKRDGRMHLTRQGMLLANEVMAVFV
jgi:oxygen-independent coproporphyrinogen-3 oxidase